MAQCPKCRISVGNAKYCPECGTKIESEVRGRECPQCKINVGNAKFCPECWTKIPRTDFETMIDDFFDELARASEEDKNEFFRLLEEDLKKKKGIK